jgi:hypothetical protein
MDLRTFGTWILVGLALLFGWTILSNNWNGCLTDYCEQKVVAREHLKKKIQTLPPPDEYAGDEIDGPSPAVLRRRDPPRSHGSMYGRMDGGYDRRQSPRWTDSNVCRPCPAGSFRRPIESTSQKPHGECNCSY